MDIGIGFLLGAVIGSVVGIIAAFLLAFARKQKQPAPSAAAPAPQKSARTAAPAAHTGNTMVVNKSQADRNTEIRQKQLDTSVQQVHQLLKQLADVVAKASAASGEAGKGFSSAKEVIDNLDISNAENIANAQQVLLGEIDKAIRANAALQTELEAANNGIEEQRRQIEELRVQARTDGLTRIPNRASFDERLREYISLLNRTGMIFTLMIADIDHFKSINDTYGHANGDRVLRGIAQKIKDGIRVHDFAARYGGEEFAVIFTSTKAEDAFIVADRLREDIAKTKFQLDDQILKVSISGGLALCSKGMEPTQIIAAADEALYRAKNGGRNQILIHTPDAPAAAAESSAAQ